jgi:UDPglucose 6-dehydrogenase
LEAFLATGPLSLTATTDPQAAVAGADHVIAVRPTNYDVDSDKLDTLSVEAVMSTPKAANPATTIVIKSTTPVGFVEDVRRRFGTDQVIFSPDFLHEGSALYDSPHSSRIIVGEQSERARIFADLLLQSAEKQDVEILFTDPSEAEAIKLFANTYLAMRVALFNRLDSYAIAHGIVTVSLQNTSPYWKSCWQPCLTMNVCVKSTARSRGPRDGVGDAFKYGRNSLLPKWPKSSPVPFRYTARKRIRSI